MVQVRHLLIISRINDTIKNRYLIEEVRPLYQVLLTALIIVAILIIIFVIMQPSKGNAASMLSGSDDGQPKTRARGFEVFLIRGTTVLGILFFILTLTLAYMSSK